MGCFETIRRIQLTRTTENADQIPETFLQGSSVLKAARRQSRRRKNKGAANSGLGRLTKYHIYFENLPSSSPSVYHPSDYNIFIFYSQSATLSEIEISSGLSFPLLCTGILHLGYAETDIEDKENRQLANNHVRIRLCAAFNTAVSGTAC